MNRVDLIRTTNVTKWVSYCCLTSNEIKFNFEYDDDYNVRFVLDEHVKLDFIVLAHSNTSQPVDMSPQSDTVFCL